MNGNSGFQVRDLACELGAGRVRHHHVGDHEREIVTPGTEHRQRDRRVLGGLDT